MALPEIQRITVEDPLYPAACRLREEVLLRPVGYDFQSFVQDYPFEDRFDHVVAVIDHPTGPAVIGTALLLPDYPEEGTGKVMQVAVDPQRRGEGVGRMLMVELERHAFAERRLLRLFCHAQIPAVAFYERIGWRGAGEIFIEAGIDHRRMEIGAAFSG